MFIVIMIIIIVIVILIIINIFRAQKLALDADEEFSGRKIDLVYGFSMGAMQGKLLLLLLL